MREIESTYKVYHKRDGKKVVFRSRLESRWAFIFDSLEINWKYEPAIIGFEENTYVPDFYLSGIGFVEIKPSWSLLVEESYQKLKYSASLLATKSNGKLYSFCSSQPTLGSKSPSKNIVEWDKQFVKQLSRNNFLELLSNSCPKLRNRSIEEISSTLEVVIRQSSFIKEKPVKINQVISKLIHKHSTNSVNEVPRWIEDGVIKRKTMTSIINGYINDLNDQIQEMYSFSA